MSDHTRLLQTHPHLHTAHLPYTGPGTQASLARHQEEGCEVRVGLPAWSASWIGKAFGKCSASGKKANSNFLLKSVLWPLPQGDRHRNLTFKCTVCVQEYLYVLNHALCSQRMEAKFKEEFGGSSTSLSSVSPQSPQSPQSSSSSSTAMSEGFNYVEEG